MVIIGALGLATDILQILTDRRENKDLYFFDDILGNREDKFFEKHPVIRTKDELQEIFRRDDRFIVGVGEPQLRKELFHKIKSWGGRPVKCISPFSKISGLNAEIGNGACITGEVVVAGNVKIGVCCLIYHFTFIAHDTVIGDFVQIAAGTKIMGRCKIDDLVMIGPNTTIVPGVKIGKNAQIGAGSVVTRDLPENCIAYGSPARVIRLKE